MSRWENRIQMINLQFNLRQNSNPLRPAIKARWPVMLSLAACILSSGNSVAETIIKKSAIAEFGEPLYAEGFTHFPYANPDAPKGGRAVLSAFGSFDTLNFYVLKGNWPGSIGLVYDSLMTGSSDEIDGLYGVLAESVEYPEDKSWAVFNLRKEAKYHDGVGITAKDFELTFNTIKENGRPFIQAFYQDVTGVEVLDDYRIKFSFATTGSMKPITIVAGMSPLPVHYWEGKDITESTLVPPLTSGPYRVKDVDAGRSITYELVEDYWGKDLPVNIGLNNIGELRYDYYRDLTVQFEAFKAGEIDFRSEPSAKRWEVEYDFDQLATGEVLKEEVPSKSPRGIGGYFFNLKRERFQDIRVREAITALYDFEAIQRTLLYGKYKRINSYFPSSDYGAVGAPTPAELEILKPFESELPPGVLEKEFILPKTDGSGRDRKNRRKALALFKEAGWEVKSGKLVSSSTGEQFKMELMTGFPESRRLALPYIEALKKSGIDASIRLVDTAQWRERVNSSDFDLLVARNNFFPPPGNELKGAFGSESADIRGGNTAGIKNPVVDALIEQIVAATELEVLQTTTRALDRVLLWNYYVMPTYYKDDSWISFWDKFGRPDQKPIYSLGFPETWWIK